MAIKQRFTYFFAGDGLDTDVWNTPRNITGTGTFTQQDAVNGGYRIIPDASGSGQESRIDFNDIRQYSPTASTVLSTWTNVTGGSNYSYVGLLEEGANATSVNTNEFVIFRNVSSGSFKDLYTGDGTTRSGTDSDIAPDNNLTNWKANLLVSSVTWEINGVAKTTKTTNLPDVALQPVAGARSLSVSSGGIEIINYEAFNT